MIAALALRQVAQFAIGVVDSTAALGRLSQQTGIGVASLSALRFAAEQSGVPFQVLEQAIGAFAQRMSQGLSQATSDVSLALASLGIAARDAAGNVLGFADFLPLVADRFAQLQDGVGKTQIAIALFGEEAGRRLIPLLNQGRAGIEALTQRARQLGLVLDNEAVRRTIDLQRASFVLSREIENLVRELAILGGPAIIAAIQGVTNLLRAFNDARRSATATGASIGTLMAEIQQLDEAANRLRPFRWLPMQNLRFEAATARAAALRLQLQALQRQAEEPTRTSSWLITVLPDPDDIARRREAMVQAQFEVEQLTQRLMGQRLATDELSIGWNTHAAEVVRATALITSAYGAAGEASRARTRLEVQLQLQEQQARLQTATMAAQTITALFPKQKGAAIAAAVINTAVGITRALSEVPWPYNWVQAGLIAAQGVAQIAAIRSASPSGGGSVSAPGGGGATPGGGGGEGGQAPTTIVIEGVDPHMIFTGAQLNNLIAAMNEEAKNGSVVFATKLV